jgi:hypothetical protein
MFLEDDPSLYIVLVEAEMQDSIYFVFLIIISSIDSHFSPGLKFSQGSKFWEIAVVYLYTRSFT